MSLNARAHVEAVALMRHLLGVADAPAAELYHRLTPELAADRPWEELSVDERGEFRVRCGLDPEKLAAVEGWLREHHPSPHDYMAAASSLIGRESAEAIGRVAYGSEAPS